MVKNKNSSLKWYKKWIVVVPLLFLLAGLVVGLIWYNNRSTTPKDKWQDGTNYRAPTEEEKNQANDAKDKIVEEDKEATETPTPAASSSKKQVNVVISDASQYSDTVEVRSFVPGYTQSGTCTVTFSKGSQTFSRDTPANRDVSSTICKTVKVKAAEFPSKGSWQVIVSYSAEKAEGKSETTSFEVN